MNTIDFFIRQELQPSLLQLSDLELRYDARLEVTFRSGRIWSQEISPNLVDGGYELVVKWPDAKLCVAVAKELVEKYPEYYASEDFQLLLQYERLGMAISKKHVVQMLESPSRFTYEVNFTWMQQYHANLGKYWLHSIAPVQNSEDDWDSAVFMNFTSVTVPTTLTDLREAAVRRRYALLQHGIGIYAPGKTPILYTNAKGQYVEHPELGVVPTGLQYLDFSQWDGTNQDYSQGDLKQTG
ncbi:hypothetical protein [Pseudomonas xantholysinigenes]|uniref:Uncharacterized protein n=1 Tax=Pseudomonas xantholysinigenes TaxID=2745490 RepID=A0A9E6Q192_9PSED|nr:hypothetical protein [Pseudomonas xantholysinigenes]QXI40091.1 hypothetical protein HU772_008460 [Pseudomonas xantholysinigenes]